MTDRVNKICRSAYDAGTPIFIDAEETWIQPAIDDLAHSMMAMYNKEKAIVYNTIQIYRHDRLQYLKDSHAKAKQAGYFYGVKLVRGAYMEKERNRAERIHKDSDAEPRVSQWNPIDGRGKRMLSELVHACGAGEDQHGAGP